jgi:Holliday junction resolvase
MHTLYDRKMKMKQITLFAVLSILVGCATTPEAQTSENGELNSSSGQVEQVETLTIRASGNVYVLVKTKSSNEQLFRGTLSEGESVTVEVDEPVNVLFTAGEHLVLEWKGGEMKPSTKGTAKLTLK